MLAAHSSGTPSQGDLRLSGSSELEIAYREGREIDVHAKTKINSQLNPDKMPRGLETRGEFGLVLATVLRDAAQGKIAWSRWEETATGIAAVFHFSVPADASHYAVMYCCLYSNASSAVYNLNNLNRDVEIPGNSYSGTPAYQGEMSIDSATGTILRLTIESLFKPTDPITRSFIAIQYGPVEIGGQSYFYPVRSLAYSRARVHLSGESREQEILRINETAFTHYHRFGSTASIQPAEPAQ